MRHCMNRHLTILGLRTLIGIESFLRMLPRGSLREISYLIHNTRDIVYGAFKTMV